MTKGVGGMGWGGAGVEITAGKGVEEVEESTGQGGGSHTKGGRPQLQRRRHLNLWWFIYLNFILLIYY